MLLDFVFGFALLAWLIALAVIVLGRFIARPTALCDLLSSSKGNVIVPERLLALASTIGCAVAYVYIVVNAVISQPNLTTLPAVPPLLLAIMAGSHGAFLLGKSIRI